MHAPSAPSPYRFLIESLLFAGYFVFGLSWIGYSPFLHEFQREYALSHSQAGLLISSVSFAKIFVPFLAGGLAARLGVHRALLLGMVGICASLFTPFAPGYNSLLVSRFVFGIGGAIVVTLFGSAVLQWFPPKERPLVNGINGIAVNAGITLSLLLTVPLAERFGRTEALTSYAVVSVLLAAGWWMFSRQIAARDEEGGRDGTMSAPAGAAPPSERYRDVLHAKETWILAIGFAGPLSIYLVFNTWLPAFYHQVLGLTRAQGAQLTGLANFVGIPAAIVGGILTRRAGARKPFIWGSGIVLSLSAFGLFLVHDLTWLTVSAVVFGVSLFLPAAPLTTIAMELPGMKPVRFGMVMGVFFGASYIVAFFAPIITGALRDATGSFQPGFILFSVFCWTLVAAGLLLPETGPSARASG